MSIFFKNQIFDVCEEVNSQEYLKSYLYKLNSPYQLAYFLTAYIKINSYFAPGIVSLTGAIDNCKNLFIDRAETLPVLRSRSDEVSSYLLSAAIDEYCYQGKVATHAQLARDLLKSILHYYQIEHKYLTNNFTIKQVIERAIKRIRLGFGINLIYDEKILFQALGFHIGQELLGIQEYQALDTLLKDKYYDLICYLKKQPNASDQNIYAWVSIHKFVEKDHFQNALNAAEKALEYYAGDYSKLQVEQWILNGVYEFTDLQKDFFSITNYLSEFV